MSRVTDILAKARRKLSDKDSTRWSDDDLLDVLNEGLKHFVLTTGILKRRSYMLIENNIGLYDISPYASSIYRIQYLSRALEIKLSTWMDKNIDSWEDTTGDEPEYVVLDTYKSAQFRLWPKVSSGSADIITQNSLFGGLIDVSITDDLFNVPNPEDLEQDISKYVVVYYIAIPEKLAIDTLDTAIDLQTIWDAALTHYIVGQCLLYDQDSISRELAVGELQQYDAYLQKARSAESADNNTATIYEAEYRGF